jgi:hypothetical protein
VIAAQVEATMPEFRFALVRGDQIFPLGEGVELPDGHAACTQAEFAIRQVFQGRDDTYDWSDWHLSIRNKDDEEFAVVSVIDTLEGTRRSVADKRLPSAQWPR